MKELDLDFYKRDCLEVAPDLVGKLFVRTLGNGEKITLRITETEAYHGTEDKACHASKGKTPRAKILWEEGGMIYVYLCYGVHWMINVITGEKDDPQAVLFRAAAHHEGPGKLTKALQVDKHLNGMIFTQTDEIKLFDDGYRPKIRTAKRVGIDYAGEEWAGKLWRYIDDSREFE